jgi:hypothetical protein
MAVRRVPTEFLQQYLALVAGEKKLDPDEQLRESLSHHAELNYKLNGGLKCPLCNAHVRHVISVEVQRGDEIRMFECLCTRCMEGERANADRVTLKLGRAIVELKKRAEPATPRRWEHPGAQSGHTNAKRAGQGK